MTGAKTPGSASASSKSDKSPEKTKSGTSRERGESSAPAKTQPEPATSAPQLPKVPEAGEARPRTRNQRNNTRRNKGDVHLVVPSGAGGPTSNIANGNGGGSVGEVIALPVPPAAFTLPAPVPVLTTEPATAAVETEQPGQPGEEGGVPPTSVQGPRRYRFDRRSSATSAAQQQTIRPERLSGARSNPTPVDETAPLAQVEAAEAEGESEPFDLFGPRQGGIFTRGSASDDILSELGLRESIRHSITPEEEEETEPFIDEEPADSLEDRDIHAIGTVSAVADDQHHIGEPEPEPEELAEEVGSPEGETGAATRRRRRRRRSSPHVTTPGEEMPEAPEAPEVTEPPSATHPLRSTASAETRDIARSAAAPSGRASADQYNNTNNSRPSSLEEQPAWDISSAQQHIRREDSPFGAPAPSFARGFGPQPRGVSSSTSSRDLYSPRPTRTERGTDTPPMSSNQLANIVASAIAQQTDRLLTELRYQQHPPSMTVMFPPMPSTERVGIFVDVANLLYSSRSLRINIDFGRLLEFLRGNRRLIRAHAYAPTNPDPGADQSFLTAVKGMGYRITTKNYKTFSSGAKKADMDLDLCMDIVRMVDAGALDTVVLVSGDSDFLPLLEYCSDHGVRVEAAAFDDSAAMILRQSCDLFINLTLATDIRA
jgi:uncharacterized LabA/DUF88 family protein